MPANKKDKKKKKVVAFSESDSSSSDSDNSSSSDSSSCSSDDDDDIEFDMNYGKRFMPSYEDLAMKGLFYDGLLGSKKPLEMPPMTPNMMAQLRGYDSQMPPGAWSMFGPVTPITRKMRTYLLNRAEGSDARHNKAFDYLRTTGGEVTDVKDISVPSTVGPVPANLPFKTMENGLVGVGIQRIADGDLTKIHDTILVPAYQHALDSFGVVESEERDIVRWGLDGDRANVATLGASRGRISVNSTVGNVFVFVKDPNFLTVKSAIKLVALPYAMKHDMDVDRTQAVIITHDGQIYRQPLKEKNVNGGCSMDLYASHQPIISALLA